MSTRSTIALRIMGSLTVLVCLAGSPLAAQDIPDQYIGFLDYGTTPWWLSLDKARNSPYLVSLVAQSQGKRSIARVDQYLAALIGGQERSATECYESTSERSYMFGGEIVTANVSGPNGARAHADWIVQGTVDETATGFADGTVGTLLKIDISESVFLKGHMRRSLKQAYGQVPTEIFVFHPTADLGTAGCFRDSTVSGSAPIVGDTIWAFISTGGDPEELRKMVAMEARESGEEIVEQTVNPSYAMFLEHQFNTLFVIGDDKKTIPLRRWKSTSTSSTAEREWLGRNGFRRWIQASREAAKP